MQIVTTEESLEVDSAKILLERFKAIRIRTEDICAHLEPEDCVVQPIVDVSPPKWHLAHTTWFFETFFLKAFLKDYKVFHKDYGFLFNSYYEAEGDRVLRTDRGNLTRPLVREVIEYRKHVDAALIQYLRESQLNAEQEEIIELGLHHEMQHQELLLTDVKYILGLNPLFPVYKDGDLTDSVNSGEASGFHTMPEGIYEIGYSGTDFHFDNERNRHKVYLEEFSIAESAVTYKSYIEFIEDGGYKNPALWHADGWAWLNETGITKPLHLHKMNDGWYRFTFQGLIPLDPSDVLMHVNFYEASAFAAWKGMRLPTEFEWETASNLFSWGTVWEWTNSAYLAYPGFKTAKGALGEYNGKFMVNQMVLRGASVATHPFQVRPTYRNFFQPQLQWQFSGIRLAK